MSSYETTLKALKLLRRYFREFTGETIVRGYVEEDEVGPFVDWLQDLGEDEIAASFLQQDESGEFSNPLIQRTDIHDY